MYDKKQILELATKLADRVSQVRPAILDSSLYGGSNQELQMQGLYREAGELVHAINGDAQRQAVAERASKLEGQIQTAAATGLIGDKDLQIYLGMIDDIYTSLDQEN